MKKGDLKRQAIIEAAEKLFYKNGYEGTSIQDVLDVLHLSKGGFYHHFDSKLHLLDAICSKNIEIASNYAIDALNSCSGDAIEKMNLLLSHIGLMNQASSDFIGLVIRVAYAGEGALLRDSLKRGYIEKLLPYMSKVINEGVMQGLFTSPYPERLPEMIMYLGACFTDEVGFCLVDTKRNPEVAIVILEKLNAYRHAIESVLCAPYGSIDLYDMSALISLIKELDIQMNRLDNFQRAGA